MIKTKCCLQSLNNSAECQQGNELEHCAFDSVKTYCSQIWIQFNLTFA